MNKTPGSISGATGKNQIKEIKNSHMKEFLFRANKLTIKSQ
jgi:hypothetical protein